MTQLADYLPDMQTTDILASAEKAKAQARSAIANATPIPVQEIHRQIDSLPPESLVELANYLEYLRFKTRQSAVKKQTTPPLRIIKLRGLLKGYDFSPELLKEARQEMWRKFQEPSA